MGDLYFNVPEQYIGKSLSQINDELTASGKQGLANPSILANYLGVDQNTPLTKDQILKLPGSRNLSSTSGEFIGLTSNFGQGMNEADYQTKKATAQQQTAVAPAISTLESGIQPLKDRYSKLIEDIKGRRETAVQNAGIATAQEYGKRGIPLSSGAYDIALRNATTPVEQAYGALETGATGEEADKINAIKGAIASLQAGAGKDAISQALSLLQLSQGQSQFEQNLDYLKSKPTSSPGLQTITMGNTIYSFDPVSGTLKPLTSGGGASGQSLESLWSQFSG